MPKFNYRRGLQRAYAISSIAWIALVLWIAIRDRPKQIDYDALAKKHGAIEVNPSEVTALPPPPPGYTPVPQADKFVPPRLDQWEGPARSEIDPLLPYWIYQSALALLPPGLGYLFLFWVLPWIGRGFTNA